MKGTFQESPAIQFVNYIKALRNNLVGLQMNLA